MANRKLYDGMPEPMPKKKPKPKPKQPPKVTQGPTLRNDWDASTARQSWSTQFGGGGGAGGLGYGKVME